MTNWTIQECPNCPGGNEDTNAIVDGGEEHGKGLIGGYSEGWDYIEGNASPGDTVTVLETDMRSAEELGYERAPLGWSPYYNPEVHGPIAPEKIPPGLHWDSVLKEWVRDA